MTYVVSSAAIANESRGRTEILPFNWTNLIPSRSCVLVARPLDISKHSQASSLENYPMSGAGDVKANNSPGVKSF